MDLDAQDTEIRARRLALLDARDGPRCGDWVRFACGTERRVSHVWDFQEDPQSDWQYQTSNEGSGYYLGEYGAAWGGPSAYVSYSGTLYRGVRGSTLTRTNETREGRVWFFHVFERSIIRCSTFGRADARSDKTSGSAGIRCFALKKAAPRSSMSRARAVSSASADSIDPRSHHPTRIQRSREMNDDIKVTRHHNGAAVRLWASHYVLGRNDAFDLLEKLRTVLSGVLRDEGRPLDSVGIAPVIDTDRTRTPEQLRVCNALRERDGLPPLVPASRAVSTDQKVDSERKLYTSGIEAQPAFDARVETIMQRGAERVADALRASNAPPAPRPAGINEPCKLACADCGTYCDCVRPELDSPPSARQLCDGCNAPMPGPHLAGEPVCLATTTTEERRSSDATGVSCPACHAEPGAPCRDSAGAGRTCLKRKAVAQQTRDFVASRPNEAPADKLARARIECRRAFDAVDAVVMLAHLERANAFLGGRRTDKASAADAGHPAIDPEHCSACRAFVERNAPPKSPVDVKNELWEAAILKVRQLEAEIRASGASDHEKSNMLHSHSKLWMFATDAWEQEVIRMFATDAWEQEVIRPAQRGKRVDPTAADVIALIREHQETAFANCETEAGTYLTSLLNAVARLTDQRSAKAKSE